MVLFPQQLGAICNKIVPIPFIKKQVSMLLGLLNTNAACNIYYVIKRNQDFCSLHLPTLFFLDPIFAAPLLYH